MNQPTEITEVHRRVVNAIWRGLRNLEILDELSDPRGLSLTLSNSGEQEMENQINRLRNEIAEARKLAPAFAEQKFREGYEWKEVIDLLSRPCLLSAFEITGIAQKASAVVEAEQVESEPEPLITAARDNEALNQQLIDAALSTHPNDPTLLSLLEQTQTDRAAHEQVQERLQEERDERKARGFD